MADARKKHTVGAATFETPSDRELVATRVVDAPRDRVWKAHTSPEHISHWMLGPESWTMPVCEIDLRPKGKWHFVWRKSDGAEMEMHGEYREVAAPERIVNTESWGSEWPETLNELILTEDAGKTTLVSKIVYQSKEVRDKALELGMTEGWAESYDRLEEYLQKTR